jgi:bifunctional DNA-binding transcriptional regulator/antitoxin component of YhaV-PrlF toxin-antitoxin module
MNTAGYDRNEAFVTDRAELSILHAPAKNAGYEFHTMADMRSTIIERGQTVIPAEIRRLFHLSRADRHEWIVDPQGIRVVPVRSDPVEAFRGQGKGGATRRLMEDRRKDMARE